MKRRSVFFATAALAVLALSAPATDAASVVVSTDSGSLGLFTLSNTAGGLSLGFDTTSLEYLVGVNGAPVGPIPASFTNPISFTDVLTTPGTSVTGVGAFSQSVIPEPTSMALMGIGLSGLFAFRRFFKRAFVA